MATGDPQHGVCRDDASIGKLALIRVHEWPSAILIISHLNIYLFFLSRSKIARYTTQNSANYLKTKKTISKKQGRKTGVGSAQSVWLENIIDSNDDETFSQSLILRSVRKFHMKHGFEIFLCFDSAQRLAIWNVNWIRIRVLTYAVFTYVQGT